VPEEQFVSICIHFEKSFEAGRPRNGARSLQRAGCGRRYFATGVRLARFPCQADSNELAVRQLGVWMTQWQAIRARISALLEAGKFLLSSREGDEVSPMGVLNTGEPEPARYILAAAVMLNQDAKKVGDLLQSFFESHGDNLPDAPRACLRSFVETGRYAWGEPEHLAGMTARITALACFRAEFEYLISDTEAVTKSLVIRAFTHLQSSIAADRTVRDRWFEALNDGEPACERLGACHLLLHGVWSFKAYGQRARTDLVLGDLRNNWDDPRRAATGLVLTEWKRLTGGSQEEVEAKADEARREAKIYCAEALAGFEVVSTRYVVLVSKHRLGPLLPNPVSEDGITYAHFNVAVDPLPPSQDARKPNQIDRRETAPQPRREPQFRQSVSLATVDRRWWHGRWRRSLRRPIPNHG
jgi:hypothetical protein